MFKYLEITDIKQGGKMKKFFVGLLSIFLLVGASILSACGSEKPVLTLSQQSVEIELYSGDVDGGYETVTAEVSNASDTSISVSANGYENIVKLSTEPTTSGKTLITITGLKEGYAEVVVRTNQGNAYKTITVDVYSEVTSMTQKTEEEMSRVRNLGKKSLKEVKEKLASLGLSFKQYEQ